MDSIVKGVLFNNNLTIHYYMRMLSWGLDCLRELNIDVLPNIKSTRLGVDRFNCVKLPTDYIGYVRIGKENGAYITEIAENKTINRLVNEDDAGTLINSTISEELFYTPGTYGEYYNEKREHLGRMFGIGEGYRGDTFKEVPEEGLIRLGSEFGEGDFIVLDYLYFCSADANTPVHNFAVATISSYIQWRYIKHLPRSAPFDKRSAEQEYWNSYRVLRARRNSSSIIDYARILRGNFKQTVRL